MSLRAVFRGSSPTAGYGLVDNSGAPGNTTINNIRGRCAVAAAASAVTVTNSLVTAASSVMAECTTNDATAIVKNVVPGAGSFVINLSAAATGNTSVDFVVFNS
jgi:hypothetical protein